MPNSPAEWIIILVVVLLLFGGSQLPKLARNLGKAQKEFKDGLDEGKGETEKPALRDPAQPRSDTPPPTTTPTTPTSPNEP